MQTGGTIALAAGVMLIILVAAAYGWYYYPGAWEEFTLKQGDLLNGVFTPHDEKTVEDLTFRDCTFTVVLPDENPVTIDVTPVLEKMVSNYKDTNWDYASKVSGLPFADNSPERKGAATLDAFTFTIPEFNDVEGVGVPPPLKGDLATKWKSAAVSFTGKYRFV